MKKSLIYMLLITFLPFFTYYHAVQTISTIYSQLYVQMMYFYFYSDYLFVYAVSCHFLCKSRLFYLPVFHLCHPPCPPAMTFLISAVFFLQTGRIRNVPLSFPVNNPTSSDSNAIVYPCFLLQSML